MSTASIARLIPDFSSALSSIWRISGSRPRMGLAISGGVDSMAMASLCGIVAQSGEPSPSFTAFIVDHKLRPGSTDEAHAVACELRHMNLQSRILTLDWTANGINPANMTHLEHAARRLRYQAMGKACLETSINSLLVAHHADDQAETVLTRLISNYHGSGLRGIKAEKPIPECQGIYGVHASGTPQVGQNPDRRGIGMTITGDMIVEGGGVSIHRPLLPYTKAELISHCKDAGVRWFEDDTNSDPQFALRNTVRHMLSQNMLPVALRKDRLLEVTAKLTQRHHDDEVLAQQEGAGESLELDTGCGRLVVKDCSFLAAGSTTGKSLRTRAMALRQCLALVAPTDTIQLGDVYDALARMDGQTESAFHVAGVNVAHMARQGPTIMQRQLPNARELKACVVVLTSNNAKRESSAFGRSPWQLWDCRYWIRVSYTPSHDEQTIVRSLTPNDLAFLRKSLSKPEKILLESALQRVPGNLRYTIPALILQSPQSTQRCPFEKVVALPTLGWSTNGWYRWPTGGTLELEKQRIGYWDVRYRKIDFEMRGHRYTQARERAD